MAFDKPFLDLDKQLEGYRTKSVAVNADGAS